MGIDKSTGIDWKWQAMVGGVITKTPLGGKRYRIESLTQTELNLLPSEV